MSSINYPDLDKINKNDFLNLLNNPKIRKHLIRHELFTIDTLTDWIHAKVEIDATSGCRVRGIICDGKLAGWCGIQLEGERYELAIIIDDKFWGLGRTVFKDMMCWAKELGHKEVYIHLLHTRPGYEFLKKVSKKVYKEKLFDNTFTTYQLTVK